MKIIRWIVYCPIGIFAFALLSWALPYILAFVLRIFGFLMFDGTGYDVAPIFELEYAIENFRSFICTTCLGIILAGGISGALAGYIAPKSNHSGIATVIFALPMLALLVLCGCSSWNSEHWFYSLCSEITFLITAFVSIGGMAAVNGEE